MLVTLLLWKYVQATRQGDVVVELVEEMISQGVEILPDQLTKTIRECKNENMSEAAEMLNRFQNEKLSQQERIKRETRNGNDNEDDNEDELPRSHSVG